jgi:uncharacterized protein YndB with AHSA1/START domain
MATSTFTKDLQNKKIVISREFAGSLEQVWRAFTDSKVLDQWWAPTPWKAKTKKQDFREGGTWLYAMVGPAGEEHWAMVKYKKIEKLKSIEVEDAFCDENGNINPDLPKMQWTMSFKSVPNGTLVNSVINFASQKDLEEIIKMGFEEGYTAANDNLDRLLKEKKI